TYCCHHKSCKPVLVSGHSDLSPSHGTWCKPRGFRFQLHFKIGRHNYLVSCSISRIACCGVEPVHQFAFSNDCGHSLCAKAREFFLSGTRQRTDEECTCYYICACRPAYHGGSGWI